MTSRRRISVLLVIAVSPCFNDMFLQSDNVVEAAALTQRMPYPEDHDVALFYAINRETSSQLYLPDESTTQFGADSPFDYNDESGSFSSINDDSTSDRGHTESISEDLDEEIHLQVTPCKPLEPGTRMVLRKSTIAAMDRGDRWQIQCQNSSDCSRGPAMASCQYGGETEPRWRCFTSTVKGYRLVNASMTCVHDEGGRGSCIVQDSCVLVHSLVSTDPADNSTHPGMAIVISVLIFVASFAFVAVCFVFVKELETSEESRLIVIWRFCCAGHQPFDTSAVMCASREAGVSHGRDLNPVCRTPPPSYAEVMRGQPMENRDYCEVSSDACVHQEENGVGDSGGYCSRL